MEITKNSKETDNIIAYWAVVKAYAIPLSLFVFASFFGVFPITVDRDGQFLRSPQCLHNRVDCEYDETYDTIFKL